jgi:hypothetical protein
VTQIGILAYGSLIDWPGDELQEVIADRRPGVTTPFKVEFARSSSRRGGAPTLAPVNQGGGPVSGAILVLKPGITEQHASDLLYRREIHQVGSGKTYRPPRISGRDTVRIRSLSGFSGFRTVLYASLPRTLIKPTVEELARLAIRSAGTDAGDCGKDWICYPMGAPSSTGSGPHSRPPTSARFYARPALTA